LLYDRPCGVPGREVAAQLERQRPCLDEIVDEAGKPTFCGLESTGEQGVELLPLRYGLAGLYPLRFAVAVEHGDVFEESGGDGRGEQPRHSSADDECMGTDVFHHGTLMEMYVSPVTPLFTIPSWGSDNGGCWAPCTSAEQLSL
jgi:hypothetical protein